VAAYDPRVDISGLAELRRELRALDKELVKAMDKRIREVDRSLIGKVRESYPQGTEEQFLSGWRDYGRTGYSKPEVDRGVKVKQGSRKRGSEYKVLKQLTQESAAGAIFDWAGRRGKAKSKSGQTFINALEYSYGKLKNRYGSRAIWRGFSLWGGFEKYNGAILKEYEDTMKAFENKVNKNG
jgi:chorismate mutase